MVREHFNELIDKYLSGTATKADQELMEVYVAKLEASGTTLLTNGQGQEVREAMWEQIQLQTTKRPAIVVQTSWYRRRLGRAVAVAASLILLVTLGWIVFRNNAEHFTANTSSANHPKLKQRSNTAAKVMVFSLEDGSTVELAPNSAINYYEPLVVNGKREIQLIGQASFNVAKDKSKPFTVYADGIATTALGTYFTVVAFDTSDKISVALTEGRVVVTSSDSLNKKLKQDFYLVPGDEMIFDKKTLLANLYHGKGQMVAASSTKGRNSLVKRPEWYTFNSASLAEVFNQLSTYYQVEIYYYPDDVINRYYSGRIEKSDSLDNILKDIALLNHFSVEKKNRTYFIQRKYR